MDPKKTFYLGTGVLALLLSLALLSFYQQFQGVMLFGNLLSEVKPIGVLAIFFIFVVVGMYIFNAAVHIIKETVK